MLLGKRLERRSCLLVLRLLHGCAGGSQRRNDLLLRGALLLPLCLGVRMLGGPCRYAAAGEAERSNKGRGVECSLFRKAGKQEMHAV